METEIMMRTDELAVLLKKGRMLPDAMFESRVSDALWKIQSKQSTFSRVRGFAVRKPLPFAAVLLLALGLIVGCAIGIMALFRGVFHNAQDSAEEHHQVFISAYPSAHAEIDSLPSEKAAEIEARLDFEAAWDLAMQRVMRQIVENSVVIGQQSENIILSEFAVCDTPGTETTVARHLYFGFALPKDTKIPDEIQVSIDGNVQTAAFFDVPMKASEAEQYAIYDLPLIGDPIALPEDSLIAVRIGNAAFCFRYCWNGKTVVLPKDEAETAVWLSIAETAPEPVTVVCLTDPIFHDGLTMYLTDLTITDDNKLEFAAVVVADESMRDGMTDVFDLSLGIKGQTYRTGISLLATRITPSDLYYMDNLTQSMRWEIALPYPPNQLRGEEITITIPLRFRIDNEEWSDNTTFSFQIKIS